MNDADIEMLLEESKVLMSVATVRLNPDDILVVMCKHAISIETSQRLKAYIKNLMPHQKVLVLGDDLRLAVLQAPPRLMIEEDL